MDGRTFLARKGFQTRLFHPAWDFHDSHLPTIYRKKSARNWYRLEVLYWIQQSCWHFEKRKKQRYGVMQTWKSTLSLSGRFWQSFSAYFVPWNQPGGMPL